ncbi:hypothetical protein [Bdellovibrio svalbardensis]|uniref:Uncharacterized protein n=1 Tax=Bdellovibrio svalbardensis TaxID=2972972 RepID=A0ABT6DJI4_9BACT|nr:hypothetical protein [Bdellovibrio svalbardensis]MDG0816079.1 hypothetical protein [Bdellovibrio svalbardensis]
MELSVKKMIVMAFFFSTISTAFAGHEWGNGALDVPLRCTTVRGLFNGRALIYSSAILERRNQALYLTVYDGKNAVPVQQSVYSYRNLSTKDGVVVLTRLEEYARREKIWLYAGVEGLISHSPKGELIFLMRFVTDPSRTYSTFKCTELPKE